MLELLLHSPDLLASRKFRAPLSFLLDQFFRWVPENRVTVRKMTSLWLLSIGYLVVLAATDNSAIVEATKEFKVGGRVGWREPGENGTSMYNDWATGMRFHVGDSLGEFRFLPFLLLHMWPSP